MSFDQMSRLARAVAMAWLVGVPLAMAGDQPDAPDSSPPWEALPYAMAQQPEPGDIVHVPTGLPMSFDGMMDMVAGARVVFIGESHDNMAAHEVQLAVIRNLERRFPGRIAIGMEMFRQPQQDVLDRWTRGELDEAAFLAAVDWQKTWRIDFGYYRAILEFARDRRIDLIALNPPKELQDQVRKLGLDALPDDLRRQLPEMGEPDRYEHDVLKAYYGGHMPTGSAFEAFFRVQRLWEESMAERVVGYLASERGTGKILVTLTGSGHVEYGFGVPKKVLRRMPVPYVIIAPSEIETPPEKQMPNVELPDIPLLPADFAWWIPYEELPAAGDTDLAGAFSSLLEQAASAPQKPPSAILLVEAPRLGLDWMKAVPGVGRDGARPPRADGTLRIASNTKTYVAAAVLRLVEDGRLDLDAPIERVLRSETVATLRAGGYRPDAITVRMLLQHTGGVYDYAGDESFIARVLQEPGRRWTRAEELAWAMSAGAPYGTPGEGFHYSDTGYILLGEVLEVVTAQPMAAAVSTLLDFDRLGLHATWFETLEPDPAGAPPRLLQHWDGMDVALIDASADLYGGGGLVSTLPELARFYRALLQGEVFRKAATRAVMLEPSPQSLASGEGGYGMGLGRLRLPGGVDCYGHVGFWGTEAWHCPAVDVTVVGAVTESAAAETLQQMTRKAVELTVGELAPRE